MEPKKSRIVVIGAGQAGASLTAKLRALGHEGTITLIGTEPYLPYQRPPLSKAYLKGELTTERLYLRPESFYEENNITVLTDREAAEIDRVAREVRLSDGTSIDYDLLAITTGAKPRQLSADQGGRLENVLTMRTMADADALAACLERGCKQAVIVGGGYIGLEAAAVLREKGLAVTVLEAAQRLLSRVAAPATADFFRDLHQGHGVDIRESAALTRLTGENGRVTGAELADGTVLAADLALVGIGITPDVDLAQAAGLTIHNGIRVDAEGRTSDPAIFAAGDCASFPFHGEWIRLESVPNAIDQAEIVAGTMLGQDVAYVAKPWFWSDQYDIKLQIAGLNTGYDRTVTRPGARPQSQSVWYYAQDKLLAVDAMNDPRAYMIGKRLIESGKSPTPTQAADPAENLKKLI